jgi:serine/threonine-protein kinase RsbT
MHVNEMTVSVTGTEDLPSSTESEVSLELRNECDALLSGRVCYRLGEEIGFDDHELWEISIVVSELVTNAIKFAGRGRLRVRLLPRPRPGIEIEVRDHGPGIANVDDAMTDGFSEGRFLEDEEKVFRRRGLGLGLGAARRLTDELLIDSAPGKGTRVIARKWLEEGDSRGRP